MAASEAILFKINGAQQTTQLAALEGKAFTVGKVSAAGNTGISKWLFLNPTDPAAAAKGSVALKIEGTRQISQLSGLAGKTVTVGKTPATLGGTGKWLLLNSGKGAVVKGAAVAGTAGVAAGGATQGTSLSEMILVKAEGGRQAVDATAMAGKTFTVMKQPMMGGMKTSNWMFLKPASGAGAAGEKIIALQVQGGTGTTSVSSLVGKSFTVSKAPMAAGAAGPQWLAFKPVAGGMASKGAVASTVAFKGAGGGACLNATPVALNGNAAGAVAQNSATLGKVGAGATAGKSVTVAKTVGGGTIWKGTGLSLGLGLGLGAWGPLLLVGVAAFGVGVYGYMKNNKSNEEQIGGELAELSLEG
ncbi:MAG: hypothetical protein HQL67_03820 [Magnetococcales bacterium]|nr:hypothetical protein [Magnetococcales bacterium]